MVVLLFSLTNNVYLMRATIDRNGKSSPFNQDCLASVLMGVSLWFSFSYCYGIGGECGAR